LKTETSQPPQDPPTPPKNGKWERWVCCYKRLDVASVLFTQRFLKNLLPLPLLPPTIAIFNTYFNALPAASMAKSDSKKRAEMMAKEWKKSRSSTRYLNHLIGMGLLHNQELGG